MKVRTEAYKLTPLTPTPTTDSMIIEATDPNPLPTSTKLATILAVMTREAHKIANGVPNEYVQAIETVNELEAFAALVYSSNFETEAIFKTIIASDTAACERRDGVQGGGNDGKGPDSMATSDGGVLDRATGVIDAAWGGFESVWGKVVGSGESIMSG